MGYRSEVVFACTADAVPTLLTQMEKSPALKELLFSRTAKKLIGDYDSEGSYLFAWDFVKWYEDDPGVQAFNEMIEKIEEKLDEESFRFVRMGEESSDVEVEGWGFENINIRRSIDY